MPYSLKHIPKWRALEIKPNGRNTSQTSSKFMKFMENQEKLVKPDDYTYMIPETQLDSFLDSFGFMTTMTQTVDSIKGIEKIQLPKLTHKPKHLDSLKLSPYPFQEIGINFLLSSKTGICGDEMGLGKTIQGLGAANELLKEGTINSVLIVPPASLKYQWKNEIEKFTDFKCIVVDGTATKRKKQYKEYTEEKIPFLIANYETVRNDIELIKELSFECMIVDESHRLKNRSTKLYKAIVQLNPEYKFALTGTPMQNKPDEIYALMSWLDPDILGKVTAFRKKHIVTGEKFGRRFMEIGYKNLDEIREKISPKMIRRMKDDVAPDLPERIYVLARADMSKPQKTLYNAIEEDFKDLQLNIQDFYETQSETDAQIGKRTTDEDKVLGFIYMMQAVSDHPLLLAQGKSKMAMKYLPLIRDCRTSPKLEELIDIISPVIESGSKIVIFSQYTQMLKILMDRIEREFEQKPYVIDGSVSSKNRQIELDNFEKNPTRQIMLLSDAGNYGLNISFASTLVNYDLPWNPAVLKQRYGRIHRINSEFKKVTFINMVTNDTIDEKILKTLEEKEQLGEGIIERTDDEKNIMNELMDLI